MEVLDRLYKAFTKAYEKMGECVPIPREQVTCDTRLREDLGMSSLAFMLVMLETEKEFSQRLDDKMLADAKTVGECIAVLERSKK